MPTVRVVPALAEVEDGQPRLGLAREATAVQQLALARGEEALTEGIVVGVTHAPHGRPDAGLAAPEAKADGRILPKFNWSLQHRTERGCDDDTKKAFEMGRTSETTLARPALGSAA